MLRGRCVAPNDFLCKERPVIEGKHMWHPIMNTLLYQAAKEVLDDTIWLFPAHKAGLETISFLKQISSITSREAAFGIFYVLLLF